MYNHCGKGDSIGEYSKVKKGDSKVENDGIGCKLICNVLDH